MSKKEKHPLRDTLIAVAAIATGIAIAALFSDRLGREERPDIVVVEETTPEALDNSTLDPETAESAEIIVKETPQEETANTDTASMDAENAPIAAPDEGEAEPVVENLPAEKIGGLGNPDDRLPDAKQAPNIAIENCGDFLTELIGASSPLLAKDGPVKAGFSVEFDGLVNPWSLLTLTQMPEDILTLNVIEKADARTFKFESDHGEIVDTTEHQLTWKAPTEPGIYCVRISEENTENKMCLHVAVLTPWDGKSERLNGYRIGEYQDEPYKGNPRYKKPRGFIEVTKENEDTWISPHLQLSQFVCKQKSDYPKYMLLDPRLLLKIETLVLELEKAGRDASHLYISSGYRTPAYNKALGNKTIYSRHLYGDAADLFVDSNQDGKLDDLDFSGTIDDGDAKMIQTAVEAVTESHRHLKGGLGFYSAANYRNPFIHIDTRGYPARWNK